ncbi:MAG TPA: M3 family oligoendopeptidase, partial [Ignavibacteria bacterium]|nr:M3 family oligoendopeptidase [Ignavibacteria bacterium]
MKFSEIVYSRPDIQTLQEKFNTLIDEYQKADSFQKQDAIMKDINNLRMEYQTQENIAHIKYSIDTFNKDYQKEQDFFDDNNPKYEGIVNRYYEAIVKSKFRKDLEAKWGDQLFAVADIWMKTYSPEIEEDLRKENELRTNYTKLIAAAKIMFDGEEKNLAALAPYMQDTNRDMRKQANDAKWKFFTDNADEFDRLYDELVKLRHGMAVKLGYKNFIQMGYDRMGRTDYNQEMVAKFRKYVLDHIVPVTLKLKKKQQQRLGVSEFKYYDQPIDYSTGNAKPHGSPEWIVNCAVNMYNEL